MVPKSSTIDASNASLLLTHWSLSLCSQEGTAKYATVEKKKNKSPVSLVEDSNNMIKMIL